MATLTQSIVIDAPVKTVFDLALDIGNVWKVKDVALVDINLEPGGVGTSASIWSHFLGFHLAGKAVYTEVVPEQKIVIEVHFFAENPTWTFTFEPEGSGTKLTLTGEWHVGAPLVGKPLETMMVKEHEPFADEILHNLQKQAESLATV